MFNKTNHRKVICVPESLYTHPGHQVDPYHQICLKKKSLTSINDQRIEMRRKMIAFSKKHDLGYPQWPAKIWLNKEVFTILEPFVAPLYKVWNTQYAEHRRQAFSFQHVLDRMMRTLTEGCLQLKWPSAQVLSPNENMTLLSTLNNALTNRRFKGISKISDIIIGSIDQFPKKSGDSISYRFLASFQFVPAFQNNNPGIMGQHTIEVTCRLKKKPTHNDIYQLEYDYDKNSLAEKQRASMQSAEKSRKEAFIREIEERINAVEYPVRGGLPQ